MPSIDLIWPLDTGPVPTCMGLFFLCTKALQGRQRYVPATQDLTDNQKGSGICVAKGTCGAKLFGGQVLFDCSIQNLHTKSMWPDDASSHKVVLSSSTRLD